ncbi:MAG: hypothetical protein Q9227_000999 [Pyrenula ochraceoflavens]
MQSLFRKLAPPPSNSKGAHSPTTEEKELFPKVDKKIDGDDCDHDCDSCSIRYPSRFKVEQHDHLYGRTKGWSTHLIVGTGKTDWVRKVEDEKGSVMEAVGKAKSPRNGKLMLSASDIPTPDDADDFPKGSQPATVLLLPAFLWLDRITPADASEMITSVVESAPTTTTPIESEDAVAPAATLPKSVTSRFDIRPCNHRAIILLCSHRTRDARCGQSAPLLRREFERHLRPLGLARDLHDERPGGVGIYFVNHVGGHKYSANVLVYRRKQNDDGSWGEGTQCIWLARVRPQECEQIVKFTVMQGKVVKPDWQLRGGFDREKGMVSW